MERHAVVDLVATHERPVAGGAAPLLQAGEERRVTGRRGPQRPGRDAAAVPAGAAPLRAVAPEVAMPAEPEDRLPADAAGAGAGPMRGLAERGRRQAEAPGSPVLVGSADRPCPVVRHRAAGRERAGKPVGAQRMPVPVARDRAARDIGNRAAAERVDENGGRQPRAEQAVAGRGVAQVVAGRAGVACHRAEGSPREPRAGGRWFAQGRPDVVNVRLTVRRCRVAAASSVRVRATHRGRDRARCRRPPPRSRRGRSGSRYRCRSCP